MVVRPRRGEFKHWLLGLCSTRSLITCISNKAQSCHESGPKTLWAASYFLLSCGWARSLPERTHIAHSPSIIIALPLHLANVKLILLGILQGNPFPPLSLATCHAKVLGGFGFQQNPAQTMAFWGTSMLRKEQLGLYWKKRQFESENLYFLLGKFEFSLSVGAELLPPLHSVALGNSLNLTASVSLG